jgi:hypothetical protein
MAVGTERVRDQQRRRSISSGLTSDAGRESAVIWDVFVARPVSFESMQPSRPSTRTLAIFGLLVVGVVCSFAFHAALTDMSVTYTATAVHPGEDPSRVADASRHIVDLDERLRGNSVAVQRPIDRAATNGSFRGDVPPELDIILDDVEARYAVYGGSYRVRPWRYPISSRRWMSR